MITVLVDATVYLDVKAEYPRFRFIPPSVWVKITFPMVLTLEDVLDFKKAGHLRIQRHRYAKELHQRFHDKANELGRPKLFERIRHEPRLRALFVRLLWEPYTLDFTIHKDKGCRARYLAVKRDLACNYPHVPTRVQRPYYGVMYANNTIQWLMEELKKAQECSPENHSETV